MSMLRWLLAGALLAQPASRPHVAPPPPWVLENGFAVPLNPPNRVRAALTLWDGFDGDVFAGAAVDLNGDGVEDYIVIGRTEYCGTGGCPYGLIDGATGARLAQIFADAIVVLAQSTHGYLWLQSYSHAGAEQGLLSTHTFNGEEYVVTVTQRANQARLYRSIQRLRHYRD